MKSIRLRRADPLTTRRLVLGGAFALIVGVFALSNLLLLFDMRSVQSKNRALVDDSLTSIELVSRIARDTDQKRLLLTSHIDEIDKEGMRAIEKKLAEVDIDFAAAARAYEPISSTTPAEHAAWRRLEGDIAEIERSIERVLELSRSNRNVEARAAMARLQGRFDSISRTADTLVQINHLEAERSVAQMLVAQRRAMWVLAVTTASGIAVALFVMGMVAHLLRRQDEQVKLALSLLEGRNRELDAFAGRVAHDLRGPLTTIHLSTTRLSECFAGEPGTMSILRRGVARMEGLIQDLLTLSRIGAQPTPGAVSQAAIVAAAAEEDLVPIVKGAQGLLHEDVEPAEIGCSDGLLRQVLWNLGENSVKYRRLDVRLEICITGRRAGRAYELRVSDNGSGMSPDDGRMAFDPFFRGKQARSTPGTGLGLAIVKRVVEASGGRVSVDSQPGRGTTFTMRLPLGANGR